MKGDFLAVQATYALLKSRESMIPPLNQTALRHRPIISARNACGLMKSMAQLAAVVAGLVCLVPASARAQFSTDTGSPANQPWSSIFSTLN